MPKQKWSAREEELLRQLVLAGHSLSAITARLAEEFPSRSVSSVRGKVWDMRQCGKLPAATEEVDSDSHPTPLFLNYMDARPLDAEDIDRIVDAVTVTQDAQNKTDPVILSADVALQADLPVALLCASCAHLGGRWTFHKAWRAVIEALFAIPRLYMLSLGDDIEGFLPGRMAADAVLEQSLPVRLQRKMLGYYIEELVRRGKLVGGAGSQHGSRWMRALVGDDPVKELYTSHHIPFFDGKGLLRVSVGDQTYRILCGHRFPGSSIYNPLHAQGRAHRHDLPSADVVVQGDKHCYGISEVEVTNFAFEVGERPTDTIWLVQVGTAKAGLDKFTIENWSPGKFIWPVVVLWPDRHQVKVTRHLSDVCSWLQVSCELDIPAQFW